MNPGALCCRIALVAILVPLLAGQSHAFDGRRNGFIIGLGLGAEYNLVNQPDLPGTQANQNRFGPAGDLRIGFSGSRLAVFFDARTALVGGLSDTDTGEDADIMIGLQGVGVTYHRAEKAPSLYLVGVVGQLRWNATAASSGDWWFGISGYSAEASGFGACVGAGWEFKRHWSLETGVLWGQVEGDYEHHSGSMERGEIDTTVSVLHLTLNGLFY